MELNSIHQNRRVILKIKEYIRTLDLNLHGYSILTEVGSGLYNYMPVIPILAGAKKVMAWTQDSSYGRASDIIRSCSNILDGLDINNNIEFYKDGINVEHLKCADMITNSGFLRPLNEEKLKYSKNSVVIPLMYESWELRNEDIDIDYCKKRDIKVAGTNESYKDLKVFQHIGYLAVKMAFEAGYEVFGNRIVVWSDDNFGEEVYNTFSKLNPQSVVKTTDFNFLKKHIKEVDFIFLCDYKETRSYNDNTFFNFSRLKKLNNSFGVIHMYGEINNIKMKNQNISLYPDKLGESKKMTFTLSHLGINSFVALMSGGFKVGEFLLKGIHNNQILQRCN